MPTLQITLLQAEAWTSGAFRLQAAWGMVLPLVRPFAPKRQLLRPLLTSRSGSTPSAFQPRGEISPGKNALLLRTTAGSTPPRLDHEGFAVLCPLALFSSAFYPVLVHRPTDYDPRFLPTLGRPHAVALHFTRRDQLVAGLAPAGVVAYGLLPNYAPLEPVSKSAASCEGSTIW